MKISQVIALLSLQLNIKGDVDFDECMLEGRSCVSLTNNVNVSGGPFSSEFMEYLNRGKLTSNEGAQ